MKPSLFFCYLLFISLIACKKENSTDPSTAKLESVPDSTYLRYNDNIGVHEYKTIDSYFRTAGMCMSSNTNYSRNEALNIPTGETQVDVAIASNDVQSFKTNLKYNVKYPLVAYPIPQDNCPYTLQMLLIEPDPQTPGFTSWYSYNLIDSLPAFVKYESLNYGGVYTDHITKDKYQCYYLKGIFECSLISEKNNIIKKNMNGDFILRVLFTN